MLMPSNCSGLGRLAVAYALICLVPATPALAHHSFAAFDITQEKTITGTVADFQWTNPHTFVWIDVPTAGGGTEKWGIEGMSPNFLERRGWSKNTLHPGDKVTVTFHPTKSGHGGSFMRVTLPDGTSRDMMGTPPGGTR